VEFRRKYPSGYFSELAQLELERALDRQGEKKIVIVSQEGNPYTKGSAVANIAYKVGDTYTISEMDPYSRAERGRVTFAVQQITDDEVIFSGGRVIDLLGNSIRLPDGRYIKGAQTFPQEFAVGKRWQSRFFTTFPNGHRAASEFSFHIETREMITVPAGTFNAYKIVARGFSESRDGRPGELNILTYLAPDKCRMPVVRQEIVSGGGRVVRASRGELVSFKES
jgi:hypothetical protein